MSNNSTASDQGGEEMTDDMLYELYCNYRRAAAPSDPSWYAAFALFGFAAIPFIFVLIQTFKKLRKSRTRFTLMMASHNFIVTWYFIYFLYSLSRCFCIAASPMMFPSAVGQLLNQLMFFDRLGLFRTLITRYTVKAEFYFKIGTCLLWLATFWLHILWVFVDYSVLSLGPPAEGSVYSMPTLIVGYVQVVWIFYVMFTEILGTYAMVRGILQLKATSYELFNSQKLASTNMVSSDMKIKNTSDTHGLDEKSLGNVAKSTHALEKSSAGSYKTKTTEDKKIKADPKTVRKYRNYVFMCMATMIFFDIMIVIWNLMPAVVPDDVNINYIDTLGAGFAFLHYVASAGNMHLVTLLWSV